MRQETGGLSFGACLFYARCWVAKNFAVSVIAPVIRLIHFTGRQTETGYQLFLPARLTGFPSYIATVCYPPLTPLGQMPGMKCSIPQCRLLNWQGTQAHSPAHTLRPQVSQPRCLVCKTSLPLLQRKRNTIHNSSATLLTPRHCITPGRVLSAKRQPQGTWDTPELGTGGT